MKECL